MASPEEQAQVLAQLRKEVNAQAQYVPKHGCPNGRQAGALDEDDGEVLFEMRFNERSVPRFPNHRALGDSHLERNEQLCLGMCIDRYVDCMNVRQFSSV